MNSHERHQTDITLGSRVTLVGAVVIALTVVAYLVAIPIGLVAAENRLSAGELALLAVLLIGLFITLQGYSIQDISVGQGGVTAKLERLSRRQGAAESEISALQVAIAAVATKHEIQHLESLARRDPFVVRFSKKMVTELERLDAIEYLSPVDLRGINAITEDHGTSDQHEFDLKAYVRITDQGLQYLALRHPDQLRPRSAR